ncbi:MAG: hypothetical protein JSV62_15905 [Promethearchaeota archaeon]|nr:MAG: hypothetical protein JSV62_15905 [Candidatus Lokiarchaeota archaeon]
MKVTTQTINEFNFIYVEEEIGFDEVQYDSSFAKIWEYNENNDKQKRCKVNSSIITKHHRTNPLMIEVFNEQIEEKVTLSDGSAVLIKNMA